MIRARSAAVLAGDGRTVDVLLVPWNAPRTVTDDGRTWYREQFTRGGLVAGPGRLVLTLEHGGPVVGRVADVHDRADGLHATLRVADTVAGRDALALIGEEALDAVSIEFDDPGDDGRRPAPGELVTRSGAVLRAVALTFNPQHDAPVLAVRAYPTNGAPMDPILDPTLDPADPNVDPELADAQDPELADELELVTAPALVTRSRPSSAAPPRVAPTPGRGRAPTRYRSFGEVVAAAAGGDPGAVRALHGGLRHMRAWADSVAADVPGLLPETWTRRLVSIMGSVAPILPAFSSEPLPDTGNTVHLGVVKQGPDFGKQVAEKTELPSRKVLVDDVAFPIELWGSGLDLGWFVWRRTSPAALQMIADEWTKTAAMELDRAAGAMITAAALANGPAVPIDPADPNAGFVDVAAAMVSSVWQWPEVCILSVDLWATLAKAVGTDGRPLLPHLSPANPVGATSITDGDGNVRGLTFAVSPMLDPGTGIAGVREAFTSSTGPRINLEADVPRLAGRDVAMVMEGAMTVTDARGLVALTTAGPLAARGRRRDDDTAK